MPSGTTRDADTKGSSVESGCSHKESFHSTSPASLGMGTAGSKDINGPQLPGGPGSLKAARGHTIK